MILHFNYFATFSSQNITSLDAGLDRKIWMAFMPANQICELVVPSPCETKPYNNLNNANWSLMWSFTSHHVIRSHGQISIRFQFSSSNIFGAWTIDSATSRYQPPSPPPLIILDLPVQILLYNYAAINVHWFTSWFTEVMQNIVVILLMVRTKNCGKSTILGLTAKIYDKSDWLTIQNNTGAPNDCFSQMVLDTVLGGSPILFSWNVIGTIFFSWNVI